MKIILLSQQGKYKKRFFAKIDDEDYDRVIQYKWHVIKGHKTYYAATRIDNRTIYLHRFILSVYDKNIMIDHPDHDGLNCQKNNLRESTPKENNRNRLKYGNTTSIFKGVGLGKGGKKWRAYISDNNRYIHLGHFHNEIDAAKAYNKKATELFGEFCSLNKL